MKKILNNRISQAQLLLTLMVWLLIFAAPLVFGEFSSGIKWQHITKVWKEFGLLLLIFLTNRFILMPGLFFKGKRKLYLVALAILLSIFTVLVLLMQDFHLFESVPEELVQSNQQPIQANPPHLKPGLNPPGVLIPPYVNLVIISILLIGFDSGLLFFSKWMQSEKTKAETEKESIKNKMAFLQNQVSPHFFMNTLNNIHALIDINSEEAKEAVIKLSKLMDYMLYESQASLIPIRQEMEFIRSYVDLMKLRIADDVDLQVNLPDTIPQLKIPPLLTISFIENAFKYGISYEQLSSIHINIEVSQSHFKFSVVNSINQNVRRSNNSGIGIANTRKRLDLIFGKNYNLDITRKEDSFHVSLQFPI